MTVASTPTVAGPFTGTGASATLPFAFKCFVASDLIVEANGAALTYGSDYTVTLNADQENSPGGTVTVSATANVLGASVYVGLNMALSQPSSFPSQAAWSPKIVEKALDRLTLIIKQITSLGYSALVAPLGEQPGLLPIASQRANHFLGFDSLGNPIALGGTGAGDPPTYVIDGLSSAAILYRFGLDFFNTGDGYQNAANLVRATDAATGTGKIYPALAIDNIVNSGRANGPANASVGLTVRSIKQSLLTSVSTQEADGLYIQTKTGRFGDTSVLLGDASGVNVPGTSTSFVNLIEGTGSCTDTSGTVISRIRFQAANQDQSATPGTINGVGAHIRAEVGVQSSALDIDNTTGASWQSAIRVYKDGVLNFQVQPSGYAGINAAVNTSIPLLIGADATSLLALRIYSTDAGAASGPSFSLFRNSGTPAINDALGYITFDGEGADGSAQIYASISAVATAVATGAEQGTLIGYANHNGSLVQAFSATYNAFSIVGPLSIGGTQVLGPRATGWTADTGTAKKTANATYAAGTTLTYSASYVQSEQTAMATRMAAVEAALQSLSQTQKAIKDAMITHGMIGA